MAYRGPSRIAAAHRPGRLLAPHRYEPPHAGGADRRGPEGEAAARDGEREAWDPGTSWRAPAGGAGRGGGREGRGGAGGGPGFLLAGRGGGGHQRSQPLTDPSRAGLSK